MLFNNPIPFVMKQFLINLLTIVIINSIYGQDPALSYIDAFAPIAVQEMERTGIPASIKLAQALLESNFGRSELATTANNHFGIKCSGDYNGKSYYREDDDRDHRGRLVESCFRSYTNAEASFIAHSDFLTNNGRSSRYNFLFDYPSDDYKKWAHGLKAAGYATDPHYSQKLINLIEKYELHYFDGMANSNTNYLASESPNKRKGPIGSRILNDENVSPSHMNKTLPDYKTHNGVKMYLTTGNESINDISNMFDIDIASLVYFNDFGGSPYDKINPKSRIYLQKKNKSFQGKKKFHQVREGERMKDISEQYAIDLDALYIKNRIPFGSEPVPGETIQLKGLLRTGKKPEITKKGRTNLTEKSRFVEETVEYIFAPKNATKD